MLYTSYFAMSARLPVTVKPVSISRTTPLWFKGLTYEKLAPSYELLWAYKKQRLETKDYSDWYYKETLDLLDAQEIYRELLSVGTPDVAVCCYERPAYFCHRSIVSGWLTYYCKVPVDEYLTYLPTIKRTV